MAFSFYWHDYETFGLDPRADRPAQFAGQRTDPELNLVEEPLELWCRLSPDYLPDPVSCGLTGIGPDAVERLGVRERDFITAIHAQMARPETCSCGYNSLRFDDELTRSTLYRNLIDPYGREWQNGNSRWDLLDALRLARAFRPEGMEWPDGEDGAPSFRLELLTAANGIPHAQAHTALADVRATIALARKLKAAQPRLWEYALKARSKHWVRNQVDPAHPQVLIHVSGMFKAAQGAFALVWPLGDLPGRPNEIALWDLRHPFEPFLDLDVETLRQHLFQSSEDLARQGRERLPAKTLHTNRCPIVVRDLRLLTPAVAERYQVDLPAAQARGARLEAQGGFRARVLEAMEASFPPASDPDFALYGGFFGNQDRATLDRISRTPPAALAGLKPAFRDPRLGELFFRYRARNWPETLTGPERARWEAHCLARMAQAPAKGLLDRAAFQASLKACRERRPDQNELWAELEAYASGCPVPAIPGRTAGPPPGCA
ncbi:MAG: exodeoxyribonuclease I [Holophaga sp.]|nr:exodeoxyribonuclease I [Holophaga sp.]